MPYYIFMNFHGLLVTRPWTGWDSPYIAAFCIPEACIFPAGNRQRRSLASNNAIASPPQIVTFTHLVRALDACCDHVHKSRIWLDSGNPLKLMQWP